MAKTELNIDDFVVIDEVPIFAEHADVAPNGDPYVIDGNTLNEIASVNNERVSRGEIPTLIVGHNEDDFYSEKPAVGFLDNFCTGIRHGVATLFARFLVYKDKAEVIREYPKRSIEFALDTLVIPACAMVGSREPRLDLGILYNSKSSNQILKFTADNKVSVERLNTYTKEDKQMVPEELKSQILAVLAETDVFAYIHQLMEDKAKETKEEIVDEVVATDEEDKVEDADKKEEFTDEAAKESDDKAEEATDKEVKVEDKAEDKAVVEDEKVDEEDKDDKKKKFTSDAEAELADLKMKFTRVEREKKLILLNSEGYDFDVAAELEDVAEMTEPQFDKHLQRIARFTKKAPIGLKKFNVQSVNIGGAMMNKEPNPEEVKAYSLKHKCSFDVAYKTLKSKI